jgi:prepilin-type N-terminal cleavage/methylation domain-containing protein
MLIGSGRRGFTLAEMMIGVVMLLITLGALHKLLINTQRLARTQAQQLGLQATVRTAAFVVLNELRELSSVPGGSADRNDLLQVAPTSLTYRAMRGVGFVCAPPTATGILIARSSYSGHRDPQPGRDTAYVFVDGGPGPEDDSWLPLGISGVSTGGICSGAEPAIGLTVPGTASMLGVEVGTPVRISEVMELRLYQSELRSWLGARSVSAGEVVQPVAGPLAESNGLLLEYLDPTGASTTDPTSIKSIRVTIRGVAEHGERMANREERLVAQVALRNALVP